MSDLINRNDLYHDMTIKRFELHEKGHSWNEFCRGFGFAMEFVKQAPSAEPERKKGEWVKDEHTYSGPNTYNYVCSACGAIGGSWLRDLPKNLMYPFCPFCGADMRGE